MILNCLEAGTASFGSSRILVPFATGTLPCFPISVPCSFSVQGFWWVENMGDSLDYGMDHCFGHVITYRLQQRELHWVVHHRGNLFSFDPSG